MRSGATPEEGGEGGLCGESLPDDGWSVDILGTDPVDREIALVVSKISELVERGEMETISATAQGCLAEEAFVPSELSGTEAWWQPSSLLCESAGAQSREEQRAEQREGPRIKSARIVVKRRIASVGVRYSIGNQFKQITPFCANGQSLGCELAGRS